MVSWGEIFSFPRPSCDFSAFEQMRRTSFEKKVNGAIDSMPDGLDFGSDVQGELVYT